MASILKVDTIQAYTSSTLTITPNTSMSGTLGVTGATTLSSTLNVTGATVLAALSATSGNFTGNLTAGDNVADAHTFTGATSITGTSGVTAFSVIGSGGGDRLLLQPESAGGGGLLAIVNAAQSDFEPLVVKAESQTFHYRTGVGTSAAGITLDSSGNTTLAGTLTLPASTPIITLGGSPSANGAAYIVLQASNSAKNWQISANGVTTPGSLEITPSTAGGGGTFTTPEVTIVAGATTLAGTLTVSGTGNSAIIGSSNSGGQNILIITNPSNTANSDAEMVCIAAGSSAGDPFIRFLVDTVQHWSFGIDNSDSDKLVISAAAALGSTNYQEITTAGAFRWNAYGAGTLTTDASGNITAVSDPQAKRNIRGFTTGLSAVLNINPILHGYSEESGLDQSKDDYIGFDAVNVQQYIPEAVGKMQNQLAPLEKDEEGKAITHQLDAEGKQVEIQRQVEKEGYLTLNSFAILAASVNAIKELNARLTTLENK